MRIVSRGVALGFAAVTLMTVLGAPSAWAHHSASRFDTTQTVVVDGMVTDVGIARSAESIALHVTVTGTPVSVVPPGVTLTCSVVVISPCTMPGVQVTVPVRVLPAARRPVTSEIAIRESPRWLGSCRARQETLRRPRMAEPATWRAGR